MHKTNNRGFTIVELLIVIVVIAILAAITIVAYNGIQNRAKSSAAAALAGMISKKVEAYNSLHGSYPTYCQFATSTTNATGTPTGIGTAGCVAGAAVAAIEAKLDDPTDVRMNTPTDQNSVLYKVCTSPARTAQLHYYDPTIASPFIKYVGIAGASSSANCT